MNDEPYSTPTTDTSQLHAPACPSFTQTPDFSGSGAGPPAGQSRDSYVTIYVTEKRVPFLVNQGGLFSAGRGHRKGTRRVRPCPRLHVSTCSVRRVHDRRTKSEKVRRFSNKRSLRRFFRGTAGTAVRGFCRYAPQEGGPQRRLSELEV